MHILEDFSKTVGNDEKFCTGGCVDLQLFTAPGQLGMLSAGETDGTDEHGC